MSNQWVKASKNVPHVFGGNVNSTLRAWLQRVGINDFVHAKFEARSINPQDLELSALHLTREYVGYDYILTVGKFADKVMTLAGLDHGALPSTTLKDRLEIEKALINCRNYLIRRLHYAPESHRPIGS